MKLEDRIRELCGQIVACQSDNEGAELARQLKELLHRRIEELRRSANAISLSANSADLTLLLIYRRATGNGLHDLNILNFRFVHAVGIVC